MTIVKFDDLFVPASKEQIDEQDILTFIRAKHLQRPYLDSLDMYYLGSHNILYKPTADVTMPSNKIVTNFCAVVVDFYTTYLMGRPVQYKSGNEPLLEDVMDIFNYNDAHETDIENVSNANIFGVGAEQLYIDRNGDARFRNVDYRNLAFIYTKDIEQSLHTVIKYYKYNPSDKFYTCEVWDKNEVRMYEVAESFQSARLLSRKSHAWGDVPFVEYPNNSSKLSSFAKILTLQDAYNTLTSLEIDDYEAFVDSFLGIYNASGTDTDDIASMKRNRVLLLDGESKAEWITKNSNPAQIEHIKQEIVNDIHRVTALPDLTDENFASNDSGVAIKYKMVGAENVAARQERKFKKGLQRRLELIVRYINTVGSTKYDYKDVDITFNRNMIGADLEIAQLISLLSDKVPIGNLASQLSFISQADLAEIRREVPPSYVRRGSIEGL